MSATTHSWSGAAAGSDEKRKKIILGALSAVLVLLLVWQVPKLLGGSSSEPTAAATVAPTSVAAPSASAVSVTGAVAPATSAATKRTILWIKSQPKHDPFVALAGNEPPAAVAATPAPVQTPVAAAVMPPVVTEAEPPAAAPATVKPSIAVVYTNGTKQAVAVGEYFKVSDLWFKLDAVGPKTMKLELVDGGFTGGRHAITIQRGQLHELANTATGVEYTLRFAQATSGIATTSLPEPNDAPAATTPATTTSTTESR
jgi:hypothetical protein